MANCSIFSNVKGGVDFTEPIYAEFNCILNDH
jgi:hypothetical protein